jgi:hypothetical protein
MKISSTYSIAGHALDLKPIERLSSVNLGEYSEDVFLSIHYKDRTDSIQTTKSEVEKLVNAFDAYNEHIKSIPPQTLNIDTVEVLDTIGPELKTVLVDQVTFITDAIEAECSERLRRKTEEALAKIVDEHNNTLSYARSQGKQIDELTNKVVDLNQKLDTITETLSKLIKV